MAGAAVYIVHLSNEDSLRELKACAGARSARLAETCTQYLVLSIEDQMPGKSWDEAKYVFTPPLREKRNQAPLWKALADGIACVVSTDHCPFRFADQKSLGRHDFRKIPNGGPGIENRLQILWHFGVNAGLHDAGEVRRAACHRAGAHLRHAEKGAIARQRRRHPAVGPARRSTPSPPRRSSMATDYSMFEGLEGQGQRAQVFSRGELVVDDGGKWVGQTGPRTLPEA
jgi:dihydropyrimidinase